MKISEILKQRGLFANEIRSRFKNGQIKLNGEKTDNLDLNVKFDDVGNLFIHDIGVFIFDLISQNKIFALQLKFFDFETLPISNIDNELKIVFNKFFIIRFSKKEVILVEKNKIFNL